jgi:hypothetical protein
VRFLAIILIALLLPLSMSVTSAAACSQMECCEANCSAATQSDWLSCCHASVAPDKAANQARDAQHLDSIENPLATAIFTAIPAARIAVIARGYSSPDRPPSIALLCSRQI